MRFRDREEGGRHLAVLLQRYREEGPIVLALPRGGVPVGYQVARLLGAPLDVIVSRKIGAPQFPEYALGAIAEGGAVFVERAAVREAGLDDRQLGAIAEKEAVELARRVRLYRGDRPFPEVRNRTAILVDDGIATGRTARAAIRAVRRLQPKRLVLAAPVVAADTVPELAPEVDDLVYVLAPEDFAAVGLWYERFGQTTDEEVVSLLGQARRALSASHEVPDPWAADPPDPPAVEEREVAIAAGAAPMGATLALPPGSRAIVLFAHGSGSSRMSPRNRHVARVLRDAGQATMLLDLLTADEEVEERLSGRLRFDIGFLARRLVAATRFVLEGESTRGLRVGYFGASTGAAAALVAAAGLPGVVAAVVSRGGRPDLAGAGVLRTVHAPTLLVVGGNDREVLDLNRTALEQLRCEKRLAVVPGASHLFEEAGALDVVADLAAAWFGRYLVSPQALVARRGGEGEPPAAAPPEPRGAGR
ncbi:MAG TPA: phosphoribosyltransferase family protein [Anaeromyxobacteraceae bacterium]|jgi:putative phosphoribosyl transferase